MALHRLKRQHEIIVLDTKVTTKIEPWEGILKDHTEKITELKQGVLELQIKQKEIEKIIKEASRK